MQKIIIVKSLSQEKNSNNQIKIKLAYYQLKYIIYTMKALGNLSSGLIITLTKSQPHDNHLFIKTREVCS